MTLSNIEPDFQPAGLIGRQAELQEITAALAVPGNRLVTLVGPAGVGKSVLAREAANQLRDNSRSLITQSLRGPGKRCVFEVGFADVARGGDIAGEIMAELRIPKAGILDPADELVAALARTDAVLVFDDVEHLLPGLAPFIGKLLGACPSLQILATSRSSVKLRGERVLRVKPLAVPADELFVRMAPVESSRFESNPAVSLFISRSTAAGASPRRSDLPIIAQICRAVEGLPLAIELIAARSAQFAPLALLKDLDLALNGSQETNAPALPFEKSRTNRHGTLRQAINCSYQLLSDSDQQMLRMLSVFSGGTSLEVLKIVSNEEDPTGSSTSWWTAALRLVDAGLVETSENADGVRVSLLHSTRSFALEELSRSGEKRSASLRHAEAFRDLVLRADSALTGPLQLEWLARLEIEHDNVLAALAFASDNSEVELLVDTVLGCVWFWHLHGHLSQARRWLEIAIAACGDDEGLLAKRGLLRSRSALLALRAGDGTEALDQIELAEQDFIESGYGASRGDIFHLRAIAQLTVHTPNMDGSIGEYLDEAIDQFEKTGDRWNIGRVLYTQASAAMLSGDLELADDLANQSKKVFKSLGDHRGAAMAQMTSGICIGLAGAPRQAFPILSQCFEVARETGDVILCFQTLLALASTAVQLGEDQRFAARLFGAADSIGEQSGLTLGDGARQLSEMFRQQSMVGIEIDKWEKAWRAGFRDGMSTSPMAFEVGLSRS